MDARDSIHEQVLVLRCQAGDREAFTSLFERYHVPLKYYLRRLLGSPESADDILQAVWLKVLREVKRLRRPESFRSWLYRIARNEALQQLRHRHRQVEVKESLSAFDQGEDDIERFTADDAARVHMALGKLSQPHREVLVLKFIEDLSYGEIASIVECGLGTVRSRIHYAKRAMRRVLEELDHDD